MSTFGFIWDNSWTSLYDNTIASLATVNTSAVDNDTKYGTQVTFSVEFSTSITYQDGLLIYFASDIDGTNFETPAWVNSSSSPFFSREPWGITIPFTLNATIRKSIYIPSKNIAKFRITMMNSTDTTISVVIKYKQLSIGVV